MNLLCTRCCVITIPLALSTNQTFLCLWTMYWENYYWRAVLLYNVPPRAVHVLPHNRCNIMQEVSVDMTWIKRRRKCWTFFCLTHMQCRVTICPEQQKYVVLPADWIVLIFIMLKIVGVFKMTCICKLKIFIQCSSPYVTISKAWQPKPLIIFKHDWWSHVIPIIPVWSCCVTLAAYTMQHKTLMYSTFFFRFFFIVHCHHLILVNSRCYFNCRKNKFYYYFRASGEIHPMVTKFTLHCWQK